MPLTDTQVRQARPKEKEYKLRDERGLLLLVRPTGAKWWRLRYKFQGKEKMISLGVYPDVSLYMARDRRAAARRLIADGEDPSAERQAEKKTLKLASEATFEKIARHYLATLAQRVRRGKGSIKTYKKAKWMLATFIFPVLGPRPSTLITASELLVELKKIELQGLHETCRRTKQRCGKVFRHDIGLGLQVRDLTPDLRGLLEAPDVEHHAALTDPPQIGELLLDIDGYSGRFITRSALRFEPLVFLRSRELRSLEWEHVDFAAAELRIPRGIMKGKRVYHRSSLTKKMTKYAAPTTRPNTSPNADA
jgi:integrase